jgi:hypothetical protein
VRASERRSAPASGRTTKEIDPMGASVASLGHGRAQGDLSVRDRHPTVGQGEGAVADVVGQVVGIAVGGGVSDVGPEADPADLPLDHLGARGERGSDLVPRPWRIRRLGDVERLTPHRIGPDPVA